MNMFTTAFGGRLLKLPRQWPGVGPQTIVDFAPQEKDVLLLTLSGGRVAKAEHISSVDFCISRSHHGPANLLFEEVVSAGSGRGYTETVHGIQRHFLLRRRGNLKTP